MINNEGVLRYRNNNNLVPLETLSLPKTQNLVLRETKTPEEYEAPQNPDTTIANITDQLQVIEIANKKYEKPAPPLTAAHANDKDYRLLVGFVLAGALLSLDASFAFNRLKHRS